MNRNFISIFASLAISLGMLFCSYMGYYLSQHRKRKETDTTSDNAGAITGAIFALLGLLIAFTFSGAYSRFDIRRQLIVQEANDIGTAYLRLDLLPAEQQAPLRELFQQYISSRAALYPLLDNPVAARQEIAKATDLQNQIWSRSIAATSTPEYQSARMLLLPALNDMIDILSTHTNAILTHPPLLIFITLTVFALACAWMTGYSSPPDTSPPHFHFLAFAVLIAFTLYIIFDIEYPRFGFINLNNVNQVLLDLKK